MSDKRLLRLLLCARPFLAFVPWLVFALSWIASSGQASVSTAFVLVLAGLAAWTLVEWILHWAMHVPVRSAALSRFQDKAHIRHHREPHDVEHSVVMLRGSIPLALVFFGLSLALLRDPTAALLFHCGLVLGYLAYELVHLSNHACWRIAGLSSLIRHHHRHHYGSWRRAYGVTTPLWDWVFGTLPDRSARKAWRAHR